MSAQLPGVPVILFTLIGLVAVGAWIYLLLGRGFFWLEKPIQLVPEPGTWPAVAAIVPARDEAATIPPVITSLLRQEYPGDFRVVLVDDHSSDGTAARALAAAEETGRPGRFILLNAPELPEGWSGKLWALNTGIEYASRLVPAPDFLLLTDADILHPPHNLRQLVARAAGGDPGGEPYDLVSLMARLNCGTVAEKLMIPAFVFFFEMLYPFRWVNNPSDRTAGAAGGVILLRRRALEEAGGLAAMSDALIDDCTLAALIKDHGRIWLGLSAETVGLRAYDGLAGIWRMVTRTAFTQLRYSLWIVAATVIGMTLTFLAPPLLLLSGSRTAAMLGAAAWLMMILAYAPTVSLYRLNPAWMATLPLAALVYVGATVDSVRRYWTGKGGEWKGRSQPKRMKNDD